jgi:hypothetical protein
MATLREYFDADFSYAAKVHVRLPANEPDVDVVVLYDFSAHIAFLACYAAGTHHGLQEFLQLIEALQPGQSQVIFDGKVTAPSARTFPGQMELRNTDPVELRAKFHGDPEWTSIHEITRSMRVFIYSESRLSDIEIWQLKRKGRELGQRVQFRSADHAEERSRFENPLAFISHDSRDKDVARRIAIGLQRLLCPVWYDEFSLVVGENLRNSIENGLKRCNKCVLVLSPHFFSNGGWTKKEFDSIFTREIVEQRQLLLPVWHGVTKESVYEYSPSLLNVKGLEWNESEAEKVCGQLYQAILHPKGPDSRG